MAEKRQSPTYRSMSKPPLIFGMPRPVAGAVFGLASIVFMKMHGARMFMALGAIGLSGRMTAVFDFSSVTLLAKGMFGPKAFDAAKWKSK